MLGLTDDLNSDYEIKVKTETVSSRIKKNKKIVTTPWRNYARNKCGSDSESR